MRNELTIKTTVDHDNTIWGESIGNISWTYIKTVADTVHEPFIILDKKLGFLTANECFEVSPKNTAQRLIFDFDDGQWDLLSLCELLEEIILKHINARQAYLNKARVVELKNLNETVSGFKITIEELPHPILTLNGFK